MWVRATIAALLLGGCSAVPSTPPAEDGPEPTAELGFTQLIPREGTRDALLRVINTSETALEVRSVAIEWPGYPNGAPSPADPTIPAGATLDLQVRLPDPACSEVPEVPVVGVVETAQGTLRQELEPTGTTYVRRLWRTQCDVTLVTEQVDISYSARWSVVGQGNESVALGDLVLRRGSGEEQVEIEGVDGSVLHGLDLPGPTTLGAGQQTARIPLAITPGNRCDEHARGQATAPFDFLMRVGVADQSGMAYPLEVPLAAMNAATAALDLACATRK